MSVAENLPFKPGERYDDKLYPRRLAVRRRKHPNATARVADQGSLGGFTGSYRRLHCRHGELLLPDLRSARFHATLGTRSTNGSVSRRDTSVAGPWGTERDSFQDVWSITFYSTTLRR